MARRKRQTRLVKPYSCLRCGRRFSVAVGQRRRYCPTCRRGLIEYTPDYMGRRYEGPRRRVRRKIKKSSRQEIHF